MGNITAEVELLGLTVDFFKSVGLTSKDIVLRVNSRKVLQQVITAAGVSSDDFAAATVIIDKLDKVGAEECERQLRENLGIPGDIATKIVNATTAPTLEAFAERAGLAGSEAAESEEIKELKQLFTLATAYGYGDWLEFDASIVRGLAYYTGIVWEGKDRAGEFRAICGGGRYDNLMSLYGASTKVPMCGFGFGDCVIRELLVSKNLLPTGDTNDKLDFVVLAYSEDLLGAALKIAAGLREAGNSVTLYQEPKVKKIGKAFSFADRCGARYVAMAAPDEWSKGEVLIKSLRETDENKKQKKVPFAKLADWKTFFAA